MRHLVTLTSIVLLGCGGIAAQGAEPLDGVVDLVNEEEDEMGSRITLHHDYDARASGGASVAVHDLGLGCRGETHRRPTWALFVPSRALRLTVVSPVPGAGLVVRLADGDIVCDVAGVVEVDAPLGGVEIWATTPSMADHPSFELTAELLSEAGQ